MEDVVVLLDMDCFFAQVAQKDAPETKDKPFVVVQYTGNGILASNYPARKYGITKSTNLTDALKMCPELIKYQIPLKDGRIDLSSFREASGCVFNIIKKYTDHFERASIDEAYICLNSLIDKEIDNFEICNDIFKNSIILSNYDLLKIKKILKNDEKLLRLVIGANITYKMRKEIYELTGFTCSAGISTNKV